MGYDDLPRLLGLLTGDEKHSGAAASTLDVLWVLYDRVLAVSPATADDPARDRFLLSKGHGPMAFYAVLAATAALVDRPVRLLSIGVPAVELRRYGTREDHDRVYGLDPAGLRARLTAFID